MVSVKNITVCLAIYNTLLLSTRRGHFTPVAQLSEFG